jgi:DNA-binding NarL/FixJ family response regulator
MITILLADDHSIVRDGLRRILLEKFSDAVILEAGNHADILKLLRGNKIDLLILDISMPGRSGLESLQTIKDMLPDIPVLILSMYPESQFAARVIKAGASGYLNKENSTADLIDAVNTILKGGKFINRKTADALVSFINQPSDSLLHQKLSDREFQVLRLTGRGLTPTEIASQLNLSVKTISTYRTHILAKLELKTTAEIIGYAIRNDLVS